LGNKCHFGDFQSGVVRNPFFREPSDTISSKQKDSPGAVTMLHYTSVFPHAFMVQCLIQHGISLPPLPNTIVPSVAVVFDKYQSEFNG
jgi:hypothetical protein